MTPRETQSFIRKSVPLSGKMGLQVLSNSKKGVRLKLPLKPNRNHLGTGFGGSQMGAQAISCWVYLVELLRRHRVKGQIVLKTCESEFVGPVRGDADVLCRGLSLSDEKKLITSLLKNGRARAKLRSEVVFAKKKCATFEGVYVLVVGESF
jgi:thioesterase domain-containing protein